MNVIVDWAARLREDLRPRSHAPHSRSACAWSEVPRQFFGGHGTVARLLCVCRVWVLVGKVVRRAASAQKNTFIFLSVHDHTRQTSAPTPRGIALQVQRNERPRDVRGAVAALVDHRDVARIVRREARVGGVLELGPHLGEQRPARRTSERKLSASGTPSNARIHICRTCGARCSEARALELESGQVSHLSHKSRPAA